MHGAQTTDEASTDPGVPGATTPSSGALRRRLTAAALVMCAPLVVCTVAVAPASAANVTKTQLAHTCTKVADALANGPDPDVDPVGYALAQIRPLRKVATADIALRHDLDYLATAFTTLYKTNDKKGTQAVVNRFGKRLDVICPGAF